MFKLVIDNSSLNGLETEHTQTIHSSLECEGYSPLKVVLSNQYIQQAEQATFEAALNRVISRAQKLDW